MVEPLDPSVEPERYKPPTSAEELLERYAAGERYFVGARLQGGDLLGRWLQDLNLADSDLNECNLSAAKLDRTSFVNASLTWCNLNGASLIGADISGTKFTATKFRKASLHRAVGGRIDAAKRNPVRIGVSVEGPHVDGLGRTVLNGCELTGADLTQSEFRGAFFHDCDLTAVVLAATVFDEALLSRLRLGDTDLSGCSFARVVHVEPCTVGTDTLRKTHTGLKNQPGRRRETETFLLGCGVPEEAIPWLRNQQQGLTLYFSARAMALDRFIIDGVIYNTVGFEHCEVAQFEQRDEGAIVRLQGSDPADLVVVAEVLHQRVWETQDWAQRATLKQLAQQPRLTVQPEDLTATADKIEKMELRAEPGTLTPETIEKIAQRIADLLGPDAAEMLRDQGAKHVQAKDSKLLMTWEQKAGRAAGRTLLKKITGGVSKEIEGQVKGTIKGLVDE